MGKRGHPALHSHRPSEPLDNKHVHRRPIAHLDHVRRSLACTSPSRWPSMGLFHRLDARAFSLAAAVPISSSHAGQSDSRWAGRAV